MCHVQGQGDRVCSSLLSFVGHRIADPPPPSPCTSVDLSELEASQRGQEAVKVARSRRSRSLMRTLEPDH